MIIINIIYLQNFPSSVLLYPNGYYGIVEKTLFNVTLTGYAEPIFNWPIVIHAVFFVVTVFNLVYALKGEQLQAKLLTEVMVYNAVITMLLVISSAVYIFFIPDIINGIIEHKFFMTVIPRQSNDIINVYNLSFLLLFIYIIINVVALSRTKVKKVVKKEVFNEGELFL